MNIKELLLQIHLQLFVHLKSFPFVTLKVHSTEAEVKGIKQHKTELKLRMKNIWMCLSQTFRMAKFGNRAINWAGSFP